jgi:hypothetical protein
VPTHDLLFLLPSALPARRNRFRVRAVASAGRPVSVTMDANELNMLLEDIRESLPLVRDGSEAGAAWLQTLTKSAAANKVAYKAIGHVIESFLLKV